ncbi:MAG TPA: SRPBCC family protein [Devosia sp.]|nr:SRPBCC family protein [Devosia sp.]
MGERSIVHGVFTVERKYKSAPAKAFQAWADPELKRQWFGSPDKANPKHVFDFRTGGREYTEGPGPNGAPFTFDVRYYDIVPDNRIVYAYDMQMSGERISVSVATVEFRPDGTGTHLVVTEHGAFLDGLDTSEQRQAGTEWLMDQLGAVLDKAAAN